MKFEFDEDKPKGDWVAAVYPFDGSREKLCFCIKSTQSKEEVWLYPDGEVSIQRDGIKYSGEPLKKFYPGDKITITF